jgi:Ca-activated chloride channel family protein
VSLTWPYGLAALLVVPAALAAFVWWQRRPSRYALAFPNLDVLATVVDRSGSWRRWVAPALFGLALTAAAFAVARPQRTVTVAREQATIVLAIDSSGSMLADDVKPSRLEAAKAAVEQFLDGLPPKYRVGMVTFAADVQVVAPPTTDHELVRSSLDFLVPLRGTAIGDAVSRAAEVARDAVGPQSERDLASVRTAAPSAAPAPKSGPSSPAAVLFLSDGYQTAGLLPPLDGAARAKQLGIPVYSIALGTDEGVLDFGFGGEERRIPVPPDRETLRLIAERTGGKYYDAPSAQALRAAYDDLGSLLQTEPGKDEATHLVLALAALLALLALGSSLALSSRIP